MKQIVKHESLIESKDFEAGFRVYDIECKLTGLHGVNSFYTKEEENYFVESVKEPIMNRQPKNQIWYFKFKNEVPKSVVESVAKMQSFLKKNSKTDVKINVFKKSIRVFSESNFQFLMFAKK